MIYTYILSHHNDLYLGYTLGYSLALSLTVVRESFNPRKPQPYSQYNVRVLTTHSIL